MGKKVFADKLTSGDFSMMLEVTLPADEESLRRQLDALADRDAWSGIVLSCRTAGASAGAIVPALQLLRAMAPELPAILVMSGRGWSDVEVLNFARGVPSGGQYAVLAVSGDLQAATPRPAHLDSVIALDLLRHAAPELLCGAAVTPAQYDHLDSTLIYGKMEKKIAAGARFLVMSALWDMKKAQELQWYLRLHDYAVPAFAEAEYFSPEVLDYYIHGEVHRSLVAGAMLRQLRGALKESPEAFRDCQMDRLARQVIGYRLLGFSGMVMRGLDTPQLRLAFLNALEAASRHLHDYNRWLESWRQDECCQALPPLQSTDYLYRDLLEPDCQYEDNDEMRGMPPWHGQPPKPGLGDRLKSSVRRILDRQGVPAALKHLAGLNEDTVEKLRKTAYLDNDSCPKALVCGACGGLQPGGRCEDNTRQCFFRRTLGLE